MNAVNPIGYTVNLGHISGGMSGFWEPTLENALDTILRYIRWETTFIKLEQTRYKDRMKFIEN